MSQRLLCGSCNMFNRNQVRDGCADRGVFGETNPLFPSFTPTTVADRRTRSTPMGKIRILNSRPPGAGGAISH